MIKSLTRCAVMIAINIISGYVLKFLPNVKPATAIIVYFAVFISLKESIMILVGTALVQAISFGFGTFLPFQILAWIIIAIVAWLLRNVLYHKVVFIFYVVLAGFMYGFITSLDMLFILGVNSFLPYYINGLIFDLFHATGNVVFSLVLLFAFDRIKMIIK